MESSPLENALLERQTWAEMEWMQCGETGQMTSQLEDKTSLSLGATGAELKGLISI